jgi:hypothetical protein
MSTATASIIILIEGGLIQNIVSTEEVNVRVIDEDTEGATPDELHGDPPAFTAWPNIEVNPGRVDDLMQNYFPEEV